LTRNLTDDITLTQQDKYYADLHIHSIYSDGSFTPYEIVQFCKKLDLKVIAITDHDTVSGIDEALSLAGPGFEVVPAVELSSNIGDLDVHILGYYINHKDADFLDYLEDFKKHRTKRVKRIIKMLSENGIKLEFEQIKTLAKDCSLGRPHVAEVLLEKGYVSSMSEAFTKYLGYGQPYYVPKKSIHPKKVIKMIKRCGGIPIIAHPGTINSEPVIYELIMHGALGLEVWHPEHTYRWRQVLYEIALKNGLLMTGGSDCHGKRADSIKIGLTGCSEKEIALLKENRVKEVL
jgi:predicted metal-dependent phosphoesterase TrpH